jgi:hypothetical protein
MFEQIIVPFIIKYNLFAIIGILLILLDFLLTGIVLKNKSKIEEYIKKWVQQ